MTLPLSYSRLRFATLPLLLRSTPAGKPAVFLGGEGRIRTFEAARATDLQSAAFDRFATSPASLCFWKRDVSVVLKKARMFLALQPMELAKGFEPPTC